MDVSGPQRYRVTRQKGLRDILRASSLGTQTKSVGIRDDVRIDTDTGPRDHHMAVEPKVGHSRPTLQPADEHEYRCFL